MFEKLRKIISVQLELDESEINLNSSLINDLEADSLDVVELIMAIEEEFSLEIPDEDAESFVDVESVLEYIKLKKN